MGAADDPRQNADLLQPVGAANAEGRAPLASVVDRPANRIPLRWAELGLAPAGRIRPIAWKADALAVSLRGTDLLHAPVAHSTVSRHVVDGNRDLRAADLAPRAPEHREIPGSAASTDTARRWRLASVHPPVEFALEYGKR